MICALVLSLSIKKTVGTRVLRDDRGLSCPAVPFGWYSSVAACNAEALSVCRPQKLFLAHLKAMGKVVGLPVLGGLAPLILILRIGGEW